MGTLPIQNMTLNHKTHTFGELGLAPKLCSALEKAGYTHPTPIQDQAIPQVLRDKDLLGCASTGTGKTAAFALPILQMMMEDDDKHGRDKKPWIRALVLAPTRELAAQIHESFEKYGAHTDLRSLVVFGGVGKRPQIQALRRGVDILVATPGRLLDLHQEGYIDLRDVEFYVLDEADRMLDMGFINDVRKITKQLPKNRQTLLFSATMPKEIQELSKTILYKPVKVAVDPISSTSEPIQQGVYFVEKHQKTDLLIHLLADEEMKSVLVFTRTKYGADKLRKKLVRAGIEAAAIHGNKSQVAREKALAGIKSGKTRVVVATDIAARGIDVKDLSHVVNYELPNISESYVHRVGRTGRAGNAGTAIAFCATDEHEYLRDIEKLTKKQLDRLRFPLEAKANADSSRTSTGSAGGRAAAQAGRSAERQERRGRKGGAGPSSRTGSRGGSRRNNGVKGRPSRQRPVSRSR